MTNPANESIDLPEDDRVFSEKFAHVIADELAAIARRRSHLRGEPLTIIAAPGPDKVLDVTALALSGGGVRSAAVGLGVLQALNDHNLLGRIDYLSTVSGGGYIGCSLSAAMAADNGVFPFGSPPRTIEGTTQQRPPAADISDTAAVGHIRNYSNYLIPRGFRDVITAAAIILRGLVANLSLVLPVLLALACVTIYSNRDRSQLTGADLVGFDVSSHLKSSFGITLAFLLVLLLLYYFWGTGRYYEKVRERATLDLVGAALIAAFVLTAFFEFQPFVIEGMFQIADGQSSGGQGLILGLFTSWVKTLAAAAAPIAAGVVFFQRQLGGLLKSVTADSSMSTMAAAYLTKAAVWVAALALPLALWIVYLYLSFWGIANDCFYAPQEAFARQRAAIVATTPPPTNPCCAADSKSPLPPKAITDTSFCERDKPPPAGWLSRKTYDHVPAWLMNAAGKKENGKFVGYSVLKLYAAVIVVLALGSLFLLPNSNSLHQLYRDRLGKAFLFDPNPRQRLGTRPDYNDPSRDQGRDFAELDDLPLSKLSDVHAPYHLINAALNIQGSDYANRRGRNADFFSFSRDWIGSEATGFARTTALEAKAPELDLATAMAISGAAASSNMGAKTIRPLTPTLALLNIRLGYWLPNPMPLAEKFNAPRKRRGTLRNSTLYLWQELTGRLYENSDDVYLTDGGHIENLGIYELLRRRCRLIIAVDAEADSSMHFPSLVTLQRYARIDLGIRINLPWERIQTQTLGWMASNAGKLKPEQDAPSCGAGPHVAIGTIDYGGGAMGHLVYIKSSLTGDENDYVRDYARRYASFPHETTGDQFFSEEQFEVYRALGFHMAHGFLSGDDDIRVAVNRREVADPTGQVIIEREVRARFGDNHVAAVRAVREALGMPVKPASATNSST
jgi:hypothetical protein